MIMLETLKLLICAEGTQQGTILTKKSLSIHIMSTKYHYLTTIPLQIHTCKDSFRIHKSVDMSIRWDFYTLPKKSIHTKRENL